MSQAESIKVTADEIHARVAAINTADDEGAHYDADQIWRDALHAIAFGNTTDPAGVAAAALHTDKLEFSRWYA